MEDRKEKYSSVLPFKKMHHLRMSVCVLGWGEWFLPQACKFISPQSSSKYEEKEWYDRDEI